jgi:hypothetical protein
MAGMSVISRETAEQILAPQLDLVGLCLFNAWDKLKAETALAVPVKPRTRANLVYDYAVAEAWRLLDGREGLTLTDQRGFLLVTIDERLLLRFKKYRKGLMTSGIATGQAQLFAFQQLTLDGMPPMTNIVAGYVLDEFQREIARVAITCRVGSRLIWAIDIPRPDAGVVIPIPAPAQPLPSPAVRSTIRQDKSEEDEGDS